VSGAAGGLLKYYEREATPALEVRFVRGAAGTTRILTIRVIKADAGSAKVAAGPTLTTFERKRPHE
jgi:hypothetical protein